MVIAVVGLTSHLESEQSSLKMPGFLDGDKTNLRMPQPEEALVQSVVATGKPVVVVLLNGSALAVNWMNQHVNAILEAWYPGEEGGAAVADTLSGKNDPAGRLDETFYRSVNQLPLFEDYSMHDLVPRGLACVGDRYACVQRLASFYRFVRNVEMGVGEGGVAKSITEGIERLAGEVTLSAALHGVVFEER